MVLFFQSIVLGMALFIILLSIKMQKIPRGLIEWIFIIGAFIILIIWAVKY